ncbi:MAG TPA: tetratricopeptide repeat protein [Thermoanaerobaculia bacterium]|nr:tetratricopeptide repeat protein [Thermoanaerobaculia bacterium]
MKTVTRTLIPLAILLLALPVLAGTQGRGTGKVVDSAGQPVEGVMVTITTPSIKTFKLNVTTKKDGSYGFIVNDATILYDLKYEKEGYAPLGISKQKFSTVDITNMPVQTLLKPSEAPARAAGGGGGAAAAPAPSANEQATVAYNEAVDALNAGNKAQGEAKLKEAVAKNPDLPQAWNALAAVAYENKDFAHALEYGQKAIDLDPSMTNLYGLLTDSAEKSGDKKAAAEWRKKYEEANADSPDILYNKGVEAYNKGKMKEAEEALTKALAAKPDHAMGHYLLGMASFNQNKKAAAREHFEKYLQLEPNGKEAATVKELLPLLK